MQTVRCHIPHSYHVLFQPEICSSRPLLIVWLEVGWACLLLPMEIESDYSPALTLNVYSEEQYILQLAWDELFMRRCWICIVWSSLTVDNTGVVRVVTSMDVLESSLMAREQRHIHCERESLSNGSCVHLHFLKMNKCLYILKKMFLWLYIRVLVRMIVPVCPQRHCREQWGGHGRVSGLK